MKKTVSIILVCAMIFTLCACGKKEEKVHKVTEADLQEMRFEPFTVFDGKDYTVKVTDVTLDENNNCSIYVEMTNKSSDDYLFAAIVNSVNSFQTGIVATKDVPAFSSAEKEIYIPEMGEYGIEYYTDLRIAFSAFLADDQFGDPVEEAAVRICPYGKDNTLKYEYTPADTDTVIVDNDIYTAIITDYDTDDLWGYSVNTVYINKTDKDIELYLTDSYINGIEINPMYTIMISAGGTAVDYISWFQSDFDKVGITEISEIIMEFAVVDAQSREILSEKEVTLEFG